MTKSECDMFRLPYWTSYIVKLNTSKRIYPMPHYYLVSLIRSSGWRQASHNKSPGRRPTMHTYSVWGRELKTINGDWRCFTITGFSNPFSKLYFQLKRWIVLFKDVDSGQNVWQRSWYKIKTCRLRNWQYRIEKVK